MKTITDMITGHPFFSDLTKEDIDFIAGCGKNVIFEENTFLAMQGGPADTFYLLREGSVALMLDSPLRPPMIYQTLTANEIVGVSWLVPPYKWTISAKAQSLTKAIALDGACLRAKCEKDPRLGYLLMKRLMHIMIEREDAFCLHLLDIFANHK